MNKITGLVVIVIVVAVACNQREQTESPPPEIEGYTLVWNDEFNEDSKPDTSDWSYENGFVRNRELQWYQSENAFIEDGLLIIEGRREKIENNAYDSAAVDWRKNRRFAEYTSSSINTRGKQSFQYGLFEVRARIDTANGMWPAIWTLGTSRERGWPANGEIDIMEFYRIEGKPTILANAAWVDDNGQSVWDDEKIPFSYFLEKDPAWPSKFHIWKMDWTEDFIKLYLDNELINEISLDETINPDGFNPFHQPHYILLNLAIGANGGDPWGIVFPGTYEVDYVRVYQEENE